MYFIPPEHNQSLKGSPAAPVKTSVGGASWAKARTLAWETAARQKEVLPEENA
jgi:hypothetical protein